MKNKRTETFDIFKLMAKVEEHSVAAFAAQSAFFFVLSLIPILLLLLTLMLHLPFDISEHEVIDMAIQIFPKTVEHLISSVITQVYHQSVSVVPITILVALWSAGRGVMALTSGLNKIYGSKETRNYLMVRIRASFYTVLFIFIIVLFLLLSVFGSTLKEFIVQHAPVAATISEHVLRVRTLVSPIVLFVFTTVIFKVLPNRKTKLRHEVPGAILSALGWFVISWVFSVYLKIFKGFSSMYGSLTTIVLVMLWLYFCMYVILLGGELNIIIFPRAEEILEEQTKEKENQIGLDNQEPCDKIL